MPSRRSSKIVACAVGPDKVGILSDFTKVVMGHGGKISASRASALDGTFSVSQTIELPGDSAGLAWALQTKMPDFIVAIRPEGDALAASTTFGRIEIAHAGSMGIVAQVTEHCASRGLGFATLRMDQTADEFFTATAVLSSDTLVDVAWLEGEFAELGEKLDISIKFEKSI